ncbi:hypothetical protein IFM89_035841 [Coptis chinensis]|uniref:Uncharacterized protein n=1 Tax=Coptis chinensis TaxID=261450 RepID=A0A835HM60_9MAGN|nr:hypothetical protein IFM89_035841 [Coptis chinensis]
MKLVLKDETNKMLEQQLNREETYWFSRAKTKWNKEGERCTGYFHRIANAHFHSNSITKLKIDGQWVKDQVVMKKHIVDYYSSLYKEECLDRPTFDGLELPCIEEELAVWMERNFEEDEVKRALDSLAGEKSPGPDGFAMIVYQNCRHFMKDSIMEVALFTSSDLLICVSPPAPLVAAARWQLLQTFGPA